MFRIVLAIVINDVTALVTNTQAETFSADNLPFLVVRPTFRIADSCTALDLKGVPTFARQTFAEIVAQLSVNEFPIMSWVVTPRSVMPIIFTLVHTQIAS
jgi:hypothetical protein